MSQPLDDHEPTDSAFDRLIGEHLGIGLDDLDQRGRLHDRRDRKYIVDDGLINDLVSAFGGGVAVLDIDRRRSFRYQTQYFDTPDLDMFHAAARGRRRRFKVRKRRYVDTDAVVCEVKTTDGLGRTIKHRRPTGSDDLTRLDSSDAAFVDGVLGGRTATDALRPVLTTTYLRTTLLDRDAQYRLTIDRSLRCLDVTGPSVGLVGQAIVEVKSAGLRTDVDRWLWRHGSRPVRFSKYATALAATRGLAHHRWHRQLRLLVPVDG